MSERHVITEMSEKNRLALDAQQLAALRDIDRRLARSQAEQLGSPVGIGDEDNDGTDDHRSERSSITVNERTDGTTSVTVRNAIGAIALPGATIYVEPKIDLSHFVHIARYGYVPARELPDDQGLQIDSIDVFLELVAQWCVEAVEKLVTSGLLADYQRHTEDLTMVRGRVNALPTSRHFINGRLKVNCSYDDVNLDHPLNRILKAAVRVVSSHAAIRRPDLRQRAARLARTMGAIGPLQPGDVRARLDRRTHRYATALDLSLRIIQAQGAGVHQGGHFGKTFLIPTPGLIEHGIREIVSRTIPSVPVRKKEKLIADQPRFGINPDLVIGVASTSTDAPITGDVKYKIAVDSWKNSRSDVAQAAMFAVGHHAKTALILTFSTDNGAPDLVLNLGDVDVHRVLWHATDVLAPHAAMDDFQRRIRTIVAAAMDRAASTVRATALAS